MLGPQYGNVPTNPNLLGATGLGSAYGVPGPDAVYGRGPPPTLPGAPPAYLQTPLAPPPAGQPNHAPTTIGLPPAQPYIPTRMPQPPPPLDPTTVPPSQGFETEGGAPGAQEGLFENVPSYYPDVGVTEFPAGDPSQMYGPPPPPGFRGDAQGMSAPPAQEMMFDPSGLRRAPSLVGGGTASPPQQLALPAPQQPQALDALAGEILNNVNAIVTNSEHTIAKRIKDTHRSVQKLNDEVASRQKATTAAMDKQELALARLERQVKETQTTVVEKEGPNWVLMAVILAVGVLCLVLLLVLLALVVVWCCKGAKEMRAAVTRIEDAVVRGVRLEPAHQQLVDFPPPTPLARPSAFAASSLAPAVRAAG